MTTERSGMSLDETPLGGRWHHGNGYLVCGSFRIAKADWEADVCSADNMRERVFDWICESLNAAQSKANGLSRDAVVSAEDRFEQYVATLIDHSADIQKLGEWLGNCLDEDDFNTVEPMILGIAEQLKEASRKMAVPNWNVQENPWYAAVTDACVINFIGWHEDDARKSLHELICWENLVALDPAVSSAARELIEKGRSEVAVPDEDKRDCNFGDHYDDGYSNGYADGWNACREAMLAQRDEVK